MSLMESFHLKLHSIGSSGVEWVAYYFLNYRKKQTILLKNKNTYVIYNSLTLFWFKKKLSGNSQFSGSLLESYIVKIKTN